MSDPDWDCLHELTVREEVTGWDGWPSCELHCDLKESHVARDEPHETTATQTDIVFLPGGKTRQEKATYRVTWKKERTNG